MNMKSVLSLTVVLVCVGFVGLAVFLRSVPDQERKIQAEMEEYFAKADRVYSQGRAEEVLAAVKQLEETKFRKVPEVLFDNLFRFYMTHGYTSEAQELLFRMHAKHPKLPVQDACLQIYNQLRTDDAKVEVWCNRVEKAGIANGDFLAEVLQWKLQVALNRKSPDLLSAAVTAIVKRLPAEKGAPLLQQKVNELVSEKKPRMAALIAAAVKDAGAKGDGYRYLILTTQVKIALATRNYEELKKLFADLQAALPDVQLNEILRSAVADLRKDAKLAFLKDSAELIAFKAADKPASRKTAALLWVELSAGTDRMAYPGFMKRLADAGLQPEIGAVLFTTYFYQMNISQEMTDTEKKAFSEMTAVGGKIFDSLKSDDVNYDSVKLALLDCSFLTDDFERAFSILKTGMPGRTDDWVQSLVVKLKAHQALKEKRYADAIAHFREFMKFVKNSMEDETSDPSTGTAYNKEMIYGRNERRIGEIYENNLKDPAAARKAYAAARKHYEAAKAAMKSSPDSIKVIDEELMLLKNR